ncbi:MAG TPA: hypothetical protein VMW31_01850 [Devosiaceae bacterium]|nr:hypothetical protein [Devosiaceae bacterium]
MVIECPACDEAGCAACDGSGQFELTGCPLEYIGNAMWSVVRLADLYRRGLPPLSAGALEQSASFVAAASMIWSEQERAKRYKESKGFLCDGET